MTKAPRQLQEQFQPHSYVVDVQPNWDGRALTGSVTIVGQKVGRPSQRLTFHQRGLTVISAEVIKHDKKGDHAIPIDRINAHASYEEVRLHAPHMLYPGRYTVRLTFSGKITSHSETAVVDIVNKAGQTLEPHLLRGQHVRAVVPHIDEAPVLESATTKS